MAIPLGNNSAVYDAQQSSSTPDQDTSARNSQDIESGVSGPERGQPKNVSSFKSLGWLDRFLALWIFLAMAVGIILGNFVPETGPALEKGKFVGVSVPIGKGPMLSLASQVSTLLTYLCTAVGLLVMMYPILCKVRYESLYEIFSQRGIWKQIFFSLFVNWVLAPFLMVRPMPMQLHDHGSAHY